MNLLTKLLAVYVVLTAASAYAEEYTFCYETWAPYAFVKDDKTTTGITVDFVREVIESLHHTATFKTCDSAVRGIDQAVTGKVTGVFFNTFDSELVGTMAPATEYWLIAALVKESSPEKKYTSMKMFEGKRTDQVIGYDYPEEVAAGLKNMKVTKVSTSTKLFARLDYGRIDVVFDDPIGAATDSKKNNFKIRPLLPLIAKVPTGVFFGPKDKAFIATYVAKAKELAQSGALDKIYKKHLGFTLKEYKTKYGITDAP